MKRIKFISILILSLCIFNQSYGQLSFHQSSLFAINNLQSRVENTRANTVDWADLIGEWDVISERIGPTGAVTFKAEGSWNISYVLDGLVIQDIFELQLPSGQVFKFIGLRIFDESTQKWQQVLIDNSEKKVEWAEGSNYNNKIILNYTHQSGAELKGTFYNISQDTFEWKQEKLDKQTGTWNMGMHTVAKRKK